MTITPSRCAWLKKLAAITLLLIATPVAAHTQAGTPGFIHELTHMFADIDYSLVIVSTGLLAIQLGLFWYFITNKRLKVNND